MGKFVHQFLTTVAMIFVILMLISLGSIVGVMKPEDKRISKPSILVMDLEGIILDGKDFLEDLRKYS